MICPVARAAVANSGIKTTARAPAISSLRMRLSSLPWGAVEDSSPWYLSIRRTLAGAGAEHNPGEPLCEQSHLDPIHLSAWKGNSANFAGTEFSEVCALAGVCERPTYGQGNGHAHDDLPASFGKLRSWETAGAFDGREVKGDAPLPRGLADGRAPLRRGDREPRPQLRRDAQVRSPALATRGDLERRRRGRRQPRPRRPQPARPGGHLFPVRPAVEHAEVGRRGVPRLPRPQVAEGGKIRGGRDLADGSGEKGAARVLRSSFLVSTLNPKVTLFYLVLFTQV